MNKNLFNFSKFKTFSSIVAKLDLVILCPSEIKSYNARHVCWSIWLNMKNLVKTKWLSALALFAGVPSIYGIYSMATRTSEYKNKMPLSKSSKFLETYQDGSFGRKYGNYLRDIGDANNDWWNWVHQTIKSEYQSADIDEKFKNAKDIEDLKASCDDLYKKNTSEIETKLESDIWRWCTSLWYKPTKVGDSEVSDGTIGKSHKDSLISVSDTVNADFWKIRDSEFPEIKDDNHKWFKGKKVAGVSIKELCKQAYALKTSQNSSEENPSDEEVVKYCSLA